MLLSVLALEDLATLVGAINRVEGAHRSVVGRNVFKIRVISSAVLTAIWTFLTSLLYVNLDVQTLHEIETVDAFNFHVSATSSLAF